MAHPLTVIVTSCDRFDLLNQTLETFFKLNKYPIVAFHIHNDSIVPVPQEVKQRWEDKGVIWHEGTKRGLSGAWDYLVGLVETEYFFNIEDDWEFFGNEHFIEQSLKIMELYSFIDQVWIRDKRDHNHPIKGGAQLFEDVQPNRDWCGFTFNPSVRKKSKWTAWFPEGIAGIDEIDISRKLMNFYDAVSLTAPAIRHTGGGRHVKNFKI